VKKLRYLSANVSSTGSLSSIETYSGKKKECKLILNASVHGCDHHSKLVKEVTTLYKEKKQWLNDEMVQAVSTIQ